MEARKQRTPSPFTIIGEPRPGDVAITVLTALILLVILVVVAVL